MSKKPQIPAIVTDLAYAGHGDNMVRGHWVGKELLGREGFWSVFGLALTGKLLPKADAALLDDLATAVFVPDPRIWPLKAAWLTGAYGSVPVGAAAPLLFLETALLGPWVCVDAARTLQELAEVVEGKPEPPVAALKSWLKAPQRGRVPGFGVVAREVDERVDFVRRLVLQHNFAERRHFRVFTWACSAFEGAEPLRPNIGCALSACFLDMGFSFEQCGALATVLVFPQLMTSAGESALARAGTLRNLPYSGLAYRGVRERRSSRSVTGDERYADA